MTKPAFSHEVREQMVGWRVLSAYQVPRDDGRKLKRCTQPSDPWRITLHDGASILFAKRILWGSGETLDAAAQDAMSKLDPADSLIGAIGRYSAAVDGLIGVMRHV